jgi:hypothetical protein
MAPEGSPVIALAHQGAEAANLMVVERSAGNPPWEPSIGNQDWARRARSEAASQLAVIVAWLTMMHGAASPRTIICGNTTMIGMTSAMSLRIRGALEKGPRLHRDDL